MVNQWFSIKHGDFPMVGRSTTNQDICSHGSQNPPSRKERQDPGQNLEPGSPIHNLPGPVNIHS